MLRIVAAPVAYLFLCIMHREILMDINDTRGDQEAGVRTLPVVFGRKAALATAASLCMTALGVTMHAATAGHGLHWLVREGHQSESGKRCCTVTLRALLCLQRMAAGSWQHHVRGLLCCVCIMTQLPLFRAMTAVLRSRFQKEVVKDAIDNSMKAVGLGLLLTAVLA